MNNGNVLVRKVEGQFYGNVAVGWLWVNVKSPDNSDYFRLHLSPMSLKNLQIKLVLKSARTKVFLVQQGKEAKSQ